MIRIAAPLLLCLLPAAASVAAAQPRPVAQVEVVRRGNSWTAEFRLAEAAAAWAFARSPLGRESKRSWRSESWTVETPGVRLERRGWYDVLVADRGTVPSRVRVRFRPYSRDIESDYDPALTFTDGSVALFDQQFKLFPVRSAGEVDRLPIDLTGRPEVRRPTRATFRDAAGPVLLHGRRTGKATTEDIGTYVLFGPLKPVPFPAMTSVTDPKLPAWLRAFLERSTPQILAAYTRALGPPKGSKPMLMLSWAGPTKGLGSMGGSVLPNLVVMAFEGDGLLTDSQGARNFSRWFIAHESAHFWLGQTVRYEHTRDGWITEGGADLLAFRSVAATDPSYDARGELQRAVDDCVKLSEGRAVSSAQERGEHRAYYACGAVFALAAEAKSGKSFAAWLKPLIDANRSDGILTRQEWLAAVGDPQVSRAIADLLDRGSPQPKAAISRLFTLAGVSFEPGPDGTPRLK